MRGLHRTTLAATTLLVGLLLGGCDPGVEAVLGPEGGTLTSEDGRLTLDVPAGALVEDTLISIELTDDGPANAYGSAYAVGPSGLPLHVPAWVVFDLSAFADPDDTAAERESKLSSAVIVGRRGNDWPTLADRTADLEDASVEATALYLSTFALSAQ